MRRKKVEGPPPFILIVQGGRLVPENAWDAERLASYSNGARLSVQITSERNEKLRRKWWAILGQVVKSTGMFPSAAKASEIVKEDLALTDSYKRDGKWELETRSLTDMGEEELLDAVTRMMDYIHDLTGIDMDQWNKETPDQGRGISDEPVDGDPGTGTSTEAGEDGTPQVTASPATPDLPEADPYAGSEAGEAGERERAPASPVTEGTRRLMAECGAKYLALTQDRDLPDARARQDMLPTYGLIWKEHLPDQLKFVKLCHDRANDVIKGELKPDDYRRIVTAAIP